MLVVFENWFLWILMVNYPDYYICSIICDMQDIKFSTEKDSCTCLISTNQVMWLNNEHKCANQLNGLMF